jgi:hypothetical protein
MVFNILGIHQGIGTGEMDILNIDVIFGIRNGNKDVPGIQDIPRKIIPLRIKTFQDCTSEQ